VGTAPDRRIQPRIYGANSSIVVSMLTLFARRVISRVRCLTDSGPLLSHTCISGCARRLTQKKALIALTVRYGADDQIWFTFFHEIAHILVHRKRHEFILDNAVEDLGDRVVDPEMQSEEEEANRFAADTLIPH
jgi:hypothetical protein